MITSSDIVKYKTVILSALAAILFLALAIVISNVTAKALGERLEAKIQQENANLHAIVAGNTGHVIELIKELAVEAGQLDKRVEAYFLEKPGRNVLQDVVQWLDANGVVMSEFLHERMGQILQDGRKEYQAALGILEGDLDSYRKALDSPYTGFWLGFNDYPKIDLNSYHPNIRINEL